MSRLPIRARKVKAGLRFVARGPHKCVKKDGKAQTGVHNALTRCLYPEYDYTACLAAGSLTRSALPPSTYFVASSDKVDRRHPRAAAVMGCRLDSQLTSSIKTHVSDGVPARAFCDKAFRDHFIRLKWGKSKGGAKLRASISRMMPETLLAWRVFTRFGLDPVSTQNVVAQGGVGTRVDVVAKDATGATRVLEIKRGCSVAFGNGRLMRAPFATRRVSTHDHYLLQTLVGHKLYKACHPGTKMGIPLLLRFDDQGAHIYEPPLWAIEGLPMLLKRMMR
jgi:hypothetical protein